MSTELAPLEARLAEVCAAPWLLRIPLMTGRWGFNAQTGTKMDGPPVSKRGNGKSIVNGGLRF